MYRPPKVRPKNLTIGGRYICRAFHENVREGAIHEEQK